MFNQKLLAKGRKAKGYMPLNRGSSCYYAIFLEVLSIF